MLAPGYGGTAEQPIVRAMAARLEVHGIAAHAISYSRARPGGDFGAEFEDVRQGRRALITAGIERVGLVGRSFGGRVCTRLAVNEPPRALVVLGHPISPPNRPRPDDEAALLAVQCPTLIVQGAHDVLGPLDVLRHIAARNRVIELYVLEGVGHQFGLRQAEGVEYAAAWLAKALLI